MSTVNPGSPFPMFAGTGITPIHAGVAVAANGSLLVRTGGNKVSLIVNVTALGGTSIQYTLQEVDPGNGTTPLSPLVSSTVIAAPGIQRIELPMVFGGTVKVSWVVVAGPITIVYATLVAVLGSMTAVSATGLDITTAPGATATSAQAIQGIAGGVPPPTATAGSGYQPDQGDWNTGVPSVLETDASGRQETHSAVTSDEGAFRDDFPAALTTALVGTPSWTNGSTTVTGSGFTNTAAPGFVRTGQYVKKSTDLETLYAQVDTVVSDTELTLSTPYGGTTATAAGVVSNWVTTTGGAGSITVASSLVLIASGATAGETTCIHRQGDYGPMSYFGVAKITQRIANQTTLLGFSDTSTTNPSKCAFFRFTGTDNTLVECVTRSSTSAEEVTVVKLAEGIISAQSMYLTIDITDGAVTFRALDDTLAAHTLHIPGPYDALDQIALISNTGGAVTTTTLSVDVIALTNFNQVQVANQVAGEPIPVRSVDAIEFGTLVGLNAEITVDMAGQAGCSFYLINDGSFLGSVVAEWSTSGGTAAQWFSCLLWNPGTSTRPGAIEVLTIGGTEFPAGSSAGYSVLAPSGAGYVRIRVSAHTSGSCRIHFRASAVVAGIQLMSKVDGAKSTYSASITAIPPAANPTDIVTIYGSATKTIRILRVEISGTRSTATQTEFALIKRSTVLTGGTFAAMTSVPHDSTDPAASATPKSWTANPTGGGTVVGTLRNAKLLLAVPASTSASNTIIWEFGDRAGAQAIVLVGVGEGLCISMLGIAMTGGGGSVDVSLEWTEE